MTSNHTLLATCRRSDGKFRNLKKLMAEKSLRFRPTIVMGWLRRKHRVVVDFEDVVYPFHQI
ncbi:hypothetical protein BC939DRAFT_241392 [Gamsiella multidivaricata]|uniref:uncharacterized protein n=1 Tax=Gamsiella multidivaricata TaxID=101098 RepID=UPI00221F8F36|nr:uncharacterized protein BC939DRAFT_241392 [Gamsiella multidivaricata]KAI7820182.1 hypothetical protein BC939DRAFT_241392 [Gamsiella multidivaricata]